MHIAIYSVVPILAMMALMVVGKKSESQYVVIRAEEIKNISCYECNNYSFNNTKDRAKFTRLNALCMEDPGRVSNYKKKCPKGSVGCAFVKTKYTRYARNPAERVVTNVHRFCTKNLLKKNCKENEGGRGMITLCTCEGDFCNSADTWRLSGALGLLVLVASTLLLRA